jgi:hypothetical protein
MKIFGVSILAAAVIFLVGFLVAKQWPQLFGSLPVLGSG